MHIFRRLYAYQRRLAKERSDTWMLRLKSARARCWARLNAKMAEGSFGEADMRHFERHMNRLSALTLPAIRTNHALVDTLFRMPITLFPRPPRWPGDPEP